MAGMVSWYARYEERVVICALHGRADPSDEEWAIYLGRCEAAIAEDPKLEHTVGLAVTDGGAPSSAQRAGLLKFGLHRPRTAVVSNNLVVRGAATALSWFNYDIGVFSPRRFADALAHLRVPSSAGSKLIYDIRANARPLGKSTTIEALTL